VKACVSTALVLVLVAASVSCKAKDASGVNEAFAASTSETQPSLNGEFRFESASVTKSLSGVKKGPDPKDPHRVIVKMGDDGSVYVRIESMYAPLGVATLQGKLGETSVTRREGLERGGDGILPAMTVVHRSIQKFDMVGEQQEILRVTVRSDKGHKYFGSWQHESDQTYYFRLYDGKLMLDYAETTTAVNPAIVIQMRVIFSRYVDR
jgi:hypothetical protein